MTARPPFFSICVPFYDTSETFVSECLKSIRDQNFLDFEVLIIDDGSSQASALMLDNLVAELSDSRFHVLHHEHIGLYEARRAAYACANGAYLVNLDSDDRFFDEEALRCIRDGVVRFDNPDLVMLNAACDEAGKVRVVDFSKHFGRDSLMSSTRFSAVLNENYAMNSMFLKVFKRDAARSIVIQAPNLVMTEDRLHTAQLVTAIESIALIDDIIIYYRQHGDSSVHKEFDIANYEQSVFVEENVMRILGAQGISTIGSANARLKWILGHFASVRRTIADYDRRTSLYSRISESDYFASCWEARDRRGDHKDALFLMSLASRAAWKRLDLCLLYRNLGVDVVKRLIKRF